MKLYAHRANLKGPGTGDSKLEAVLDCLRLGISVEIDVRAKQGEIWVGHSEPEWKASPELLKNKLVMSHAKDIAVVSLLAQIQANFFCLEQDMFALCSNGLIWTNYGTNPTSLSIMCSPELVGAPENIKEFYKRISGQCYGVCTDYPLDYQRFL